MNEKRLDWLLNSRAYQKSKDLVGATIRSPERLLQLVDRAQSKTSRDISGRLAAVLDSSRAALRLMKAYAAGSYRQISFESLALIVASIIYFVMPLDVIPDFILALGFTDDAALLAWTFRAVATDIEKFLAWEAQHQSPDQGEMP